MPSHDVKEHLGLWHLSNSRIAGNLKTDGLFPDRRPPGISDKSAYALPGEHPDLLPLWRVRPHDNLQGVAGNLEMAYETFTNIRCRKRAFKVVRNSLIGGVYGVGSKVCVVSVDRLAVIAWSGARWATINCKGRSSFIIWAAMWPLESYIK